MAHSSWVIKKSSLKELFRKVCQQGLGKSVKDCKFPGTSNSRKPFQFLNLKVEGQESVIAT